MFIKKVFVIAILLMCLQITAQTVNVVKNINNDTRNSYYPSNRAPLTAQYFIKLPVTAIKPSGWLKKQLELQKEGLTGHLGEISKWLSKDGNSWLSKDGKGEFGWEELPYWLKGYGNIAYMFEDEEMIKNTKFWIEAVINNQRENGDFGPMAITNAGTRDLWTNMPMLWCLQSYYEYSKDNRVIDLMTAYFKWELSLPDEKFLETYWENSRGGDNLISVYWLYNRTGDSWLLDLATKIDDNTADWRQKNNLPNWHNVNIAQCFREPATYAMQSKNPDDITATYNDFNLIRDMYGQVPGGMFGADENAREGYTDPRQAVETCGMVEQMTSDGYLLQFTGDPMWADNCEDVAFNTFPAAFTSDYKALRYLTAPNMVLSDSKNHSPGIDNSGPFLNMNPFSSRCCQHNHSAGWVYYAENTWMATPDNGLVAQLYTAGSVTAKVGNGEEVKVVTTTHYPFSDEINFKIHSKNKNTFPIYFRVPKWCNSPKVFINGKEIYTDAKGETYIKIENEWKDGDGITLQLPKKLKLRKWKENKNSVSLNYGPLTFSLKIEEEYFRKDSKETAIGDSKWQEEIDQTNWPTWEIHPGSAWNYGLIINENDIEDSFKIEYRDWPKNDNPFTNNEAPIIITAKAKQIPSWTIDKYGLCGILPQSPVVSSQREEEVLLVPLGGARLRIASFPVIAE